MFDEPIPGVRVMPRRRSRTPLIVFCILLFLIAVGVSAYYFKYDINALPIFQKLSSDQVCLTVITEAKNPRTGEIRTFADPCQVPKGWEILEKSVQQETSLSENATGTIVYSTGQRFSDCEQACESKLKFVSDQGEVRKEISFFSLIRYGLDGTTNYQTGLTVVHSRTEQTPDYHFKHFVTIVGPDYSKKEIEINGLFNDVSISPRGDYFLIYVSRTLPHGAYPAIDLYKSDGTFVKSLIPHDMEDPTLKENFPPITWSKDQSQVFLASRDDPNPEHEFPEFKFQVVAVDVASGAISQTKILETAAPEIAPSPDGDIILGSNSFFGLLLPGEKEFRIFTIDMISGVERNLVTGGVTPFSEIDWSPSRKSFLFLKNPGEISSTSLPATTKDIYIMNIEGGSPTQVNIPGKVYFVRDIGWVTDKRIAFVTDNRENAANTPLYLFAVDTDGQNLQKIDEAPTLELIGFTSSLGE